MSALLVSGMTSMWLMVVSLLARTLLVQPLLLRLLSMSLRSFRQAIDIF
mgnify:CR=1 FL=1